MSLGLGIRLGLGIFCEVIVLCKESKKWGIAIKPIYHDCIMYCTFPPFENSSQCDALPACRSAIFKRFLYGPTFENFKGVVHPQIFFY